MTQSSSPHLTPGSRRIRCPARNLERVEDVLQDARLLVQSGLNVRTVENDRPEAVLESLGHLTLPGAEADREQRQHTAFGIALPLYRGGLQLQRGRQVVR